MHFMHCLHLVTLTLAVNQELNKIKVRILSDSL